MSIWNFNESKTPSSENKSVHFFWEAKFIVFIVRKTLPVFQ